MAQEGAAVFFFAAGVSKKRHSRHGPTHPRTHHAAVVRRHAAAERDVWPWRLFMGDCAIN